MKVGIGFIAIVHESLIRRKIETDGFFVTKDISMIGTQPIHANDNIKTLYGNRHKIDGKRMITEGKGSIYEYIANVLFLDVRL